MKFKVDIVIIVAIVIVALFAVGYLRLPSATAGENVWFQMEASFTYRGNEDNTPIENFVVGFLAPNVDNDNIISHPSLWALYYQDNVEQNFDEVFGFQGNRTENLTVSNAGLAYDWFGPALVYTLDKLYPGESFRTVSLFECSNENVNKVSLKVYNENAIVSAGSIGAVVGTTAGLFEKPIDVSFSVQLFRLGENQTILLENFYRDRDNILGLTTWLYPS